MAAVLGNLYDALREAGVSDERAHRAAEELFEQTSEVSLMRVAIARIESEISTLKQDVAELKQDVSTLKSQMAEVRSNLAVMRWMLGFVIAMCLAILTKLFLGH
jgi:predicted RNase H-like nuclease (RuvC/YqgF family)